MSTTYKGMYRATNAEATNEFGTQFMQSNVDYVADRLAYIGADGHSMSEAWEITPPSGGIGVGTRYRRNGTQQYGGAEYYDGATLVAFLGIDHTATTVRYNAVATGWVHNFLTQSVSRLQLDGTSSPTQTPVLVNLNGTMRRVQTKAGNALVAGDLVCVLV